VWSDLSGAGSVQLGCGGVDLGRGSGLFSLNLSEREMA
jgi:hypothetical protein